MRLCVLACLSSLLGACATRGPLVVDCEEFPRFVTNLPYTPLEAQIRHNWPPAVVAGGDLPPSPAARPVITSVRQPATLQVLNREKVDAALASAQAEQQSRPSRRGSARPSLSAPEATAKPSVLLLSGGGQWGAFGAGLLTTLAAGNAVDQPNPVAITGVSTGALQMLFVGAGLDDPDVRAALRSAYLPEKESEIVDRQGTAMAVLTGAISGLKPLRRRVERALCPDEAIETGAACPLLDRIAQSNILMLAGFVEAQSGRFQFVDVNAMATAPDLDARKKRQCIAGAALASAAMPVFFQQVKIAGKTYFDGGVRQSVFATFVQQEIANHMAATNGDLPLLVLRNGPTGMDDDARSNGKLNALEAGLRAEAIIVNQVEVGSVAALRLQLPRGPIGFASADGWQEERLDPSDPASSTCLALKTAGKDAQFTPAFMRCLMAYGDRRAREARIWLPLLELEQANRPHRPAS